MTQIKKAHLDFMGLATIDFSGNVIQETYRNEKEFPNMMALRMGYDRDCVEVYENGERVANFVQVMEPKPYPDDHVLKLVFDAKSMMRERPQLMKYNSDVGLLCSLVRQAKEIDLIARSNGSEEGERLPEACAVMTYLLACIYERYGK